MGEGALGLRLLLGAMCLAGGIGGVPAYAQQDDPSVVMRRPLPFQRNGENQEECQKAGTCPQPENPEEEPVGECDPLVEVCEEPGGGDPQPPTGNSIVVWIANQWEGTAVCGGSSSLTRRLTCTQYNVEFESDYPAPCDEGSEEWCDPDAPSAPSRDDNPKLYDLDIPAGMLLTGATQVSNAVCESYAVNPKPITTYNGNGGGCSYEVHEDPDDITWTLPPYAVGSATCSPNAEGKPSLKCYNTNTAQYVSYDMCKHNPVAGGVAIYRGASTVYGNNSGCSYSWEESELGGSCNNAQYMTNYTHYCMIRYPANQYSEEMLEYVDDESDCTAARPADVQRHTGSCYFKFPVPQSYAQRCSGGETMQMRGFFQGQDGGARGDAACDASGATCCQPQNTFDQNRTNGRPMVIGKTGGPVSSPFTYYDDCPDGQGTCFIEAFGGSTKRWLSYCPYGPC